MLETVLQYGTGRAAAIGQFAAGKTGTTSNYGDAWFVGWDSKYTVAVWVGYPDKLVPMTTDFNGSPVLGGTFPALIWHDFMTCGAADRQGPRGTGRKATERIGSWDQLEGHRAAPKSPVTRRNRIANAGGRQRTARAAASPDTSGAGGRSAHQAPPAAERHSARRAHEAPSDAGASHSGDAAQLAIADRRRQPERLSSRAPSALAVPAAARRCDCPLAQKRHGSSTAR